MAFSRAGRPTKNSSGFYFDYCQEDDCSIRPSFAIFEYGPQDEARNERKN